MGDGVGFGSDELDLRRFLDRVFAVLLSDWPDGCVGGSWRGCDGGCAVESCVGRVFVEIERTDGPATLTGEEEGGGGVDCVSLSRTALFTGRSGVERWRVNRQRHQARIA